ncbi:MAG: RNA methyltransferase [bacterium]|nr:RNA methyltransferase [bacterium]
MAGTNSSKPFAGDADRSDGPAFVLVNPQLGENIGAAARAMLNCGLTDLRLVRPRDAWPSRKAYAMASGANIVLDRVRIFDTVADAVADLQHLFATTARHRDMVKHEVIPAEAAAQMRRRTTDGERCGVLFGPERIGLTNDEVTLADAILRVPLNPRFCSLNLGQAVLLVAWEWYRLGDRTPARLLVEAGQLQASRQELLGFLDHLERELDASGFFKVEELRPSLVRNLRNLFLRAQLTDREVRTLRGVVKALSEWRSHRPRQP